MAVKPKPIDLREYVSTKELAHVYDISSTTVIKILKNLGRVTHAATFYYKRSEAHEAMKPFLAKVQSRSVSSFFHYFSINLTDVVRELRAINYPFEEPLRGTSRIPKDEYEVLWAIFTHDDLRKDKHSKRDRLIKKEASQKSSLF